MGLLEKVRGFRGRPSVRAASGTIPTPLKLTAVDVARCGIGPPWSAEDYLGSTDTSSELLDHWSPDEDVAVAAVGPAVGRDDRVGLEDPVVPAVEGSRSPPSRKGGAFDDFEIYGAVAIAPDAVWSDHGEPDLPFFDPGATAAPVLARIFEGPHQWRVGTRAGLLAIATAIPHRQGRDLAARAFEEALAEARWPDSSAAGCSSRPRLSVRG